MKRLIVILGLLFTTNVYAGQISIQPFISGNDVTIAHLEAQRSTIQNAINGNIEGGSQNIRAGSITSSDLATAINPVTFRNEAFNDWTYSGMLPPTSGTLSTTITAGVSYVNGVRVETAATAHTFTASKDTYLYINAGGYFDYIEVANGASAPATPSNELLLAVVITNGTAITSVTDSRTLSIQITANSSNFAIDYRNQAVVSMDTTTTMHAEPGQLAIGTSAYTNLSDTSSKSTATLGNWIEGSVPSLANLKFYVYAYNNSGTNFDIKYASADPVYSDSSLNTNGSLQYYVTGGTTYRVLAWVSADSSGLIQSSGYSNFPSASTKNMVSLNYTTHTTCTTAIPDDDTIPLQTEGDQIMAVPFRASNANSKIRVDAVVVGSGNNTRMGVALFRDATATALAASSSVTATDGTQSVPLTYTFTAGSTALMNLRIRAGSSTPNAYINGISSGRKYGGAMVSNLTVTEITD